MSELPGGIPPAVVPVPRDSASGIVLRGSPGGALQVLLGRRSRRSRFMPDHLALPGGVLEPADRPDEHLSAMEKIFKSLQNDNFRRFLRQASTKKEIVELLEEADEVTA